MRVSIPTLIVLFATVLTSVAWSAVPPQPAAPGMCQIADDSGCGIACGQRASCGCEDPGECGDELPNVFAPFWGCRKGPCIEGYAEIVALQRNNTRSQPLFLDRSGEIVTLNAQDMNFSVETGLNVGVIGHVTCCWDIEVAYFQLDGWSSDRHVPGLSQMVTDVNGGNFFVNNAEARYTSEIFLGEINLRREWFDGLTILAGFRMGELDEMYRTAGAGLVTGTTVDMYNRTYNHLYGFQVGADWEFYNMGGPLTIRALCKAGIYGNAALQRAHQADSNNPQSDVTIESTRSQAAFLGETGLILNYCVTKHLSFRASAQAVWLEGVALAPEQINQTDFNTGIVGIDTHGGIFYYGGGLGAEVKF